MKNFLKKLGRVLKIIFTFLLLWFKDLVGGLILLIAGTAMVFIMGLVSWALMGYSGVLKFLENILKNEG